MVLRFLLFCALGLCSQPIVAGLPLVTVLTIVVGRTFALEMSHQGSDSITY